MRRHDLPSRMTRLIAFACAVAACGLVVLANAVPGEERPPLLAAAEPPEGLVPANRLVDVSVVHRDTGERLTPYRHAGKLYVAGTGCRKLKEFALGNGSNHKDMKMLRIVVKNFMDAHTFDAERAEKCCFGVSVGGGKIIPFCVNNIFHRCAHGTA